MIRKCLLMKAILLSALVWTLYAGAPGRDTRATGPGTGEADLHHAGIQRVSGRQRGEGPAGAFKCLDDFVAKFPNSTLMPYVYQLYYQDLHRP